jgi:hypothetical protein
MFAFSDDEFWEEDEEEPQEACQPLEQINDWIKHGKLESLIANRLDANLYGGGFKHFDINGFIEVVRSQNWKRPDRVQLWIKGGEEGMNDEPFTEVGLFDEA